MKYNCLHDVHILWTILYTVSEPQAPPEFTIHQSFPHDQSKSVKVTPGCRTWSSFVQVMAFTKDGRKLAWSNMISVKVRTKPQNRSELYVQIAILTNDGKWTVQHDLPQSRVGMVTNTTCYLWTHESTGLCRYSAWPGLHCPRCWLPGSSTLLLQVLHQGYI